MCPLHQRNALRIQDSGVSLYAPYMTENVLFKLYNLLKNTPQVQVVQHISRDTIISVVSGGI